jgi:branched-chain amino acid transport system substrate-binding protein
MNKKIGIILVILAVTILVVVVNSSNSKKPSEVIRIGMILPLSGTASQYGEQIRNGAEIARNELLENGYVVEIVYEDNKGDPATAVSAYRKIVDIHKVDYIVTALTRSSIPLIGLSKDSRIPMIMTLVAGNWDKDITPYVMRFFPTARQYVRADDSDKVLNGLNSIGVIYVNDEYGNSVLKEVDLYAKENGLRISSTEGYLPNNQDYRLLLSKIKNSGANTILMISSSPVELSTIIKQHKELGLKQKIFDVSIGLSNPNIRKDNSDILDGVITRATQAELMDRDILAEDFFDKYRSLYNQEAYFPALFGFESVRLINKIDNLSGNGFLDKVSNLKSISTIMGDLFVTDYQEINPPIFNAVIEDGQLRRSDW